MAANLDEASLDQKAMQAATALEFRKANEAIGFRVSAGRLSLLSRKLFNIMVYNAQQLGKPGKNAPVDTEVAKQYFWMPLAEVARNAAYDSNDTQLLKDHIEELQNIKITLEDHREWTSETLVSSVKLLNPAGLRKRGGTVWLGFAFPPEVSALVMNPGTYTKLSIYYQTMLRSGASLALYEICRRYATNPSNKTAAKDWEWWYESMSGTPIGGQLPEYKYFKRDVIKSAIVEINTVTDITIELVEHKNGRRVVMLQFNVRLKAQPSLEFPALPIIDAELIQRIIRLGFSQAEAADLSVIHPEEKLKAALDAVAQRMNARNSAPLDSPAAYFRWTLKNGSVLSKPESRAQTEENVSSAPKLTLRERYITQRCRDAIAYFEEIDESQRDEILRRFKVTKEGRAISSGKGLTSPLFRNALGLWLMFDLWGDPTDTEILQFAETSASSNSLVQL
jgi:Initiator Replication protein